MKGGHMASVSTSIDIGTAPDQVWDLVTDLDRLGEWVTIHRALHDPAPAAIEEGTTFGQTLEVAGTPFDVDWTATAVDAPQRLVWEGAGPAGSRARTSYALAAQDGGTRFTYENEFALPGGAVGDAAGGVVASRAGKEAEASLQRLKQLAEA
jgi:uncharacterized protein YndB with AHSA1/START domain